MSLQARLHDNSQPVWVDAKYVSVDSVDGRHFCYKNVKFRVTDKNLIIKTSREQIFFNLDNVICYAFEE